MKFIRSWFPVFVWMVIIFFLSGRPSVKVANEPILNFFFFKTLHVIEYGILFVLYVRALRRTSRLPKSVNPLAIAFVFTVFYATTDEIHQLFVPTREGRLRDVIIDALGAGISWITLYKLLPKAPKKLQIWAKKLELL